MSEDIKFLAKVRKIGTSLGITIPKYVREFYELKMDDFIQVSLEKMEKENSLKRKSKQDIKKGKLK